jgi:poly(3-hydroxybutyrate) depolymerase
LIFYALPNGNTIEQTIGKQLLPGDDWHFDIQHIGAQTRFLREVLTHQNVVVAYLENSLKSWPAWRRQHGDDFIPELLDTVKRIFAGSQMEVVLTGHSGGGSLTFGYLNRVTDIPADVRRIAFLDSNYAYETAKHADKLLRWLQASRDHRLCVLAYDDANALLDGKSFVSPEGGTWGRSHAMLDDFGPRFTFTSQTNNGLATHSALNGQIQFLLKENPDRKILHTVQVARNGFIHAMLSGTANEGMGYEYFGERAYQKWIRADSKEK